MLTTYARFAVGQVRTIASSKLAKLGFDQRGVTAIEYALIAALIAVVIIGAVSTLGKDISNVFTNIGGALNNVAS